MISSSFYIVSYIINNRLLSHICSLWPLLKSSIIYIFTIEIKSSIFQRWHQVHEMSYIYQQNKRNQGCQIWTQSGSDWHQIGHNQEFLRSDISVYYFGAVSRSVLKSDLKHKLMWHPCKPNRSMQGCQIGHKFDQIYNK